MDSRPLNPGVDIGRPLSRLGDINLGLAVESLKIRQLPLRDEAIHERRSQLVELEQNNGRYLRHSSNYIRASTPVPALPDSGPRREQ